MNSCSRRHLIFVCFILLSLRQEIPVAEAYINVNNTACSKEAEKDTIHKENKPNSNNVPASIHKEDSQNSENEAGTEVEEDTDSSPSINHNRPRQYHVFPGRKLKTRRRCRPYEVLDKEGKCVRKIGKQGLYQHKNHVYGLQRRHRHPSFDQK